MDPFKEALSYLENNPEEISRLPEAEYKSVMGKPLSILLKSSKSGRFFTQEEYLALRGEIDLVNIAHDRITKLRSARPTPFTT